MFFIVPADESKRGKTENTVITFETDCGTKEITLNIHYSDEHVENGGYNELWRLSRLNWLNSNRFLNSEVVPPYTEPLINNNDIKILGRDISFGTSGLPSQVAYYFDEGIYLKDTVQKNLLACPLELKFHSEDVNFSGLKLISDKGRVYISSKGTNSNFDVSINGVLFYEGFIDYKVRVTAKKDFTVPDVSLEASINNTCAEYINGLGAVGGKAYNLSFKWTNEKQLDCLYTGAVNGGVRFKWKAENYVKPLINIYYKNLPLKVPSETWDNAGRGSIVFDRGEEVSIVIARTSEFSMKRERFEALILNFILRLLNLLIIKSITVLDIVIAIDSGTKL